MQIQVHDPLSVEQLVRLSAWMDRAGLPPGIIEDLTPLAGGTQNIMLTLTRGGLRCVLRRPPLAKRAQSDQVMRREARILAALADTAVPHARLIACCEDLEVLGAVFYLMQPVAGFNAAAGLPVPHGDDAALRQRMGLSMVEALVTLGEVDYIRLGLADLGQPDGFLERQAARWLKDLDGYTQLPGYARSALPDVTPIVEHLQAHVPPDFKPGLMHGDYHLANLMFAPGSAEVAAIVDWEMCTLGDPLLDFAWMLETWPVPERRPLFNIRQEQTMTPLADLIAHYAARSSRSLRHLDWYRVLACYRNGIILEGTYARACAGKAPRATGEFLHGVAVELIERALNKISERR